MTVSFSPPLPGEPVWIGAKVLAVEIEVAHGAAAALLPAPLRLAAPPTATLFVADYPETRFGSTYREAAVILHGTDARGFAGHCPWMVVDDDTALILGRELLGFPKKMADISLEVDADRAVGVVTRKGGEIMRLEAELGEVEAEPAPLFGRRGVNVFGSIVGGMKLLELPPANETIHTSRRAEAKAFLGRTDRDPLADLEPGRIRSARYVVCDFGTGEGTPTFAGDVDGGWGLPRFFARAL